MADAHWSALYAVDGGGNSTLLAGILPGTPRPGLDDGGGHEARFDRPCAIAADGWTVYVADFGNNCIRAVEIPPNWQVPAPPPETRDAYGPRRGRRSWQEREGGRTAD